MTVTLFIPCFVDLFYPQVGISMVRILEKLGHRVECPEAPACCGQPAFNTGYWEESRAVARPVLEQLQEAEAVVIASGSCGAMMKEIPDGQLFWIIKNGSLGTGMMAFPGLPDEQVWQLVQYIRSLAK